MNFSPAAGNTTPEVRTVTAWHEALNSRDVERLVGLSHPDVRVGGPRGTGHGVDILREWVDRAGIRLTPGRTFHGADTVVVEQRAEWRSTQAGGPHIEWVASVFVVSDGLVSSVVRYPGLAEALRAAGLDESHERGRD